MSREMTTGIAGNTDLTSSERLLSLLFANALDPMALLRVEADGQVVYEAVNASALQGIREQFPHFDGSPIDRPWLEIVRELGYPPELIDQIAAHQREAIRSRGVAIFDYEMPGKVARKFVLVRLKAILDAQGRCSHLLWKAFDLTRQKTSERTLRESEQRLSLIFNATSDLQALYRVVDSRRLILEAANRSFQEGFRKFLSSPAESLDGLCRTQVMTAVGADANYIEQERLACVNAMATRNVQTLELPLSHPQGEMFLEVRIEPVADSSNECSYILWTGRDVTFRRQAEQDIRSSEEMYRLLFEQMPDGVFVIGLDDEVPIKFSESWADSLGYLKAEKVALPLRQLCYSEEDYLQFRAILRTVAQDRKRRIAELRFTHRNGSPRHFELNIAPIERDGRLLFQCIARDITEHNESQSQIDLLRNALAHVSRLGTMGEMATGLAHELNQPLGALHLYSSSAQLVAQRFSNPDLNELLQKISDQSLRAGEIIRRMRAFIDRRPSVRKHCDLNQLIRDVLKLLESDLRAARVLLCLELEQTLPNAWADAIQIQQVLVNLIRNALDSMASCTSSRQLTIKTRASKTHLEVAITDTGVGIAPDFYKQLFLPFSSSKPNGLGLGLAICRTLIDAHGGGIDAQANAAGGATFRFTLPNLARAEGREA